MARGKKVVKQRSNKVPQRKRMLGEQEVFPIRCVSRREGMKYDILGGFVRLGRTGTVSYTHLTLPTILLV